MKTLPSPPDSPAPLAALLSPPTSPTSPRTTPRIRPKVRSLGNIPSLTNPERHAKSLSSSFSVVNTNPDSPRSQNRTVAPVNTQRAVAGKRRKPSIAYYTPSSPSPWDQRPRLHRTSSSGPRDGEPAVANGEGDVSQRSSLVLGSPPTRESVRSLDGVNAREREPLTLVEKHADLLHFIAQKERKCLELRDQLAAHEEDLSDLKRKWERIVNRGYDPLSNPPASLGGVALDGLKESVRIIAAGFSDLGGAIQELESSDENNSKPRTLTHPPHEHLQTGPTPSVQEVGHASGQVLEAEEGETMATAPSLSRAGSLSRRIHKRASYVPAKELTTAPMGTFAPPSAQKHKPADLDVGMSLVLAPKPTLVLPLSGSVKPVSARPALKSPVLGSAWTAVPMNGGPMSSWVDSMGKKLSELQKGQTFSKSQKRASLLFAGVSNTITSALSPGPIPTTPAPAPTTTTSRIPSSTIPPSTSPVPTKSSLITVPPSPQPQPHLQSRPHPPRRTTIDWLEDDQEQWTGGALLIPDSKQQSLPVRTTGMVVERGVAGTTSAATALSSFDDDDWNW